MEGTVRGGTVPLTISYRKVTKRPEIKRTRKFIGFRAIGRKIAMKAIEVTLDLAYEMETEVLDAGQTEVVHWALHVEEPWGPNNNSSIRCVRLPEKPPAGMSLEIVQILEEPAPTEPDQTVARRPANHAEVRRRMAEALQRDGHFDPEDPPRPTPVKTFSR